jgi:hypothetical protein
MPKYWYKPLLKNNGDSVYKEDWLYVLSDPRFPLLGKGNTEKLLLLMLNSPNYTVKPREIKKFFGYSYVISLNSIVGHFGRRCADDHGWQVPSYEDTSDPDEPWNVPFLGETIGPRRYTWMLRPELLEALVERYPNAPCWQAKKTV